MSEIDPQIPTDLQKLFKPGATTRMFFPDLLPEYERIIYVDTDIIFVQSPELIWNEFSKFNGSHIAGMGPENMYSRYI